MKKIYGYAFASALMALASCSSDAPEINTPEVIDGPVVGYVKMNLPAGTRADSDYYVKFTKGGVEVKANLVGSISAEGEAEYAVSDIPDKVVVFKDANLAESRETTTDNVDAKTPAVFGDNTYGSDISAANIYNTQGSATPAQVVSVYLDRTIAEVTTDASKATVSVDSKLSGYKVTFTPEYVFVNGVATKTPIIKTVPQASTPGGATVEQLGYSDTNGKGSHWTKTYYDWNTTDVRHYSLTNSHNVEGQMTGNKSNKQENAQIFERAMQTASTVKKNHTHVIVAGKYTLTAGEDVPAVPSSDWDGTFYVYGADLEGKGHVYFTEADVLKAMDAKSLVKDVTTEGGMSTHMIANNGKTCLKYDKGYVYYAEPIVTKIGDVTYGNGVVRNHKYKINVNNIVGWGTAIPDTDEPIIPEDPKDPEENYIKLNIVVNPWQPVTGQNINW